MADSELRWSTLPSSSKLPYSCAPLVLARSDRSDPGQTDAARPHRIYTSSNRSATYAEANILTDNPTDINSRWSGNPNLHNEGADGDVKDTKGSLRNAKVQFIVLELEQPALVTRLGFGKYYKSAAHARTRRRSSALMSLDDRSPLVQPVRLLNLWRHDSEPALHGAAVPWRAQE